MSQIVYIKFINQIDKLKTFFSKHSSTHQIGSELEPGGPQKCQKILSFYKEVVLDWGTFFSKHKGRGKSGPARIHETMLPPSGYCFTGEKEARRMFSLSPDFDVWTDKWNSKARKREKGRRTQKTD